VTWGGIPEIENAAVVSSVAADQSGRLALFEKSQTTPEGLASG